MTPRLLKASPMMWMRTALVPRSWWAWPALLVWLWPWLWPCSASSSWEWSFESSWLWSWPCEKAFFHHFCFSGLMWWRWPRSSWGFCVQYQLCWPVAQLSILTSSSRSRSPAPCPWLCSCTPRNVPDMILEANPTQAVMRTSFGFWTSISS